MFEPLNVASTGMNAFDQEMIDITNNLANARTTGFKSGSVELESLFYQVLEEAGRQLEAGTTAPEGVEFGTGVRVAATPKDFSQGTLEVTTSPLDIAIEGEGFFQFRRPDGEIAYSRAGNLHRDADGSLVDPNGNFLEPQITIPSEATDIIIQPDGRVLVQTAGTLDLTEVGQITLAKFTNPGGLTSLGKNLYANTSAAGSPTEGLPSDSGYGNIAQYSLETSNVDVIEEMMRMIVTQRVFDTITKAVQSYEAMLASVIKMRG